MKKAPAWWQGPLCVSADEHPDYTFNEDLGWSGIVLEPVIETSKNRSRGILAHRVSHPTWQVEAWLVKSLLLYVLGARFDTFNSKR